MEKKILRLLIAALGLIILLVVALSVLFGLALRDVRRSIAQSKDSDIVAAIKSLRVINGVDGKDGQSGLSIVGPPGKDGTNSTSTIVVQQVPIKGDKGDPGLALPVKEPEFDGLGNWRYKGDEIWLPLFSQTLRAE